MYCGSLNIFLVLVIGASICEIIWRFMYLASRWHDPITTIVQSRLLVLIVILVEIGFCFVLVAFLYWVKIIFKRTFQASWYTARHQFRQQVQERRRQSKHPDFREVWEYIKMCALTMAYFPALLVIVFLFMTKTILILEAFPNNVREKFVAIYKDTKYLCILFTQLEFWSSTACLIVVNVYEDSLDYEMDEIRVVQICLYIIHCFVYGMIIINPRLWEANLVMQASTASKQFKIFGRIVLMVFAIFGQVIDIAYLIHISFINENLKQASLNLMITHASIDLICSIVFIWYFGYERDFFSGHCQSCCLPIFLIWVLVFTEVIFATLFIGLMTFTKIYLLAKECDFLGCSKDERETPEDVTFKIHFAKWIIFFEIVFEDIMQLTFQLLNSHENREWDQLQWLSLIETMIFVSAGTGYIIFTYSTQEERSRSEHSALGTDEKSGVIQ